MKKIFALMLAAALFSSCGVVKVAMDTRDKDGSRVVLTSDKHIFNHIDVALGAKIKNQKDTVMAVLVTYDGKSNHGVFAVGSQMKFRLSDDSVITLSNIYDREYEKNTETYTTNELVTEYGYAYAYDPFDLDVYVAPYEASAFVPRVRTSTSTLSYGLFLITKKQLQDIIGKGAVKLRIETDSEELDLVSGAERISAVFAEQYACLKENFGDPHHRSSF